MVERETEKSRSLKPSSLNMLCFVPHVQPRYEGWKGCNYELEFFQVSPKMSSLISTFPRRSCSGVHTVKENRVSNPPQGLGGKDESGYR